MMSPAVIEEEDDFRVLRLAWRRRCSFTSATKQWKNHHLNRAAVIHAFALGEGGGRGGDDVLKSPRLLKTTGHKKV